MNIRLRAVELQDVDLIYEWENDFALWNISPTRTPFSRYAIEEYVKSSQNEDIFSVKQVRFMIDIIQQQEFVTVGCIDLYDFEPDNMKAGVGILIDKGYRRKGIGANALQKLWDYAQSILHLNQLYAFIPCDNENSLKLFESVGFEKTSTLKDWLKVNNDFIDVNVVQRFK